MREAGERTLRTTALRLFLTSIAINAALGIWALLVEDFGGTQEKILASSFLVSGAMLAVLINGAPLTRRVLWPVPLVAVSGLVLGFVLLLVAVWAEVDSVTLGKSLGTAFVLGGAATVSGLLGLLPLRPAHHLLRLVANALVAALAVTVVAVIWMERGGPTIARVIGVQSILVAACTLALPALSRFLPVEDAAIMPGSGRYCPGCGAELDEYPVSGAPVGCGRCARVFSVTEQHRV